MSDTPKSGIEILDIAQNVKNRWQNVKVKIFSAPPERKKGGWGFYLDHPKISSWQKKRGVNIGGVIIADRTG